MVYLGYAASLVSIVCWIMTLIKIFQDKEKNGILHGIIGILCGLWAFIFGWMNTDRYGNKQIMLIWTAAIVVGIIANAMAASTMTAG